MLDYLALATLIFAFITLFYGIIVVHDIPFEIAVHRNHPHQDAIHIAGWISMFTLGAIWPFLWIWATLYREDRGWGFVNSKNAAQVPVVQSTLDAFEKRIEHLEQLNQIKAPKNVSGEQSEEESK